MVTASRPLQSMQRDQVEINGVAPCPASHEAVGNVKRNYVVEVGDTLFGVLYPFKPMGELMPSGCKFIFNEIR